VLRACCDLPDLVGEEESGEAVAGRSPSCRSDGLCRTPETDPSLRMPLRTPAKKSAFSGEPYSSSVAESEGVENLDSSEPGGREVSLSDMINHSEITARESRPTLEGILPACSLHISSLITMKKKGQAYSARKVEPNEPSLWLNPLPVMMFGGYLEARSGP
jgi:hypothetical protein